MKITEINIEQLLPLFMRDDPSNQAIAEVTSEVLQVFANEIAKLSTFDALDLLNTAELDELAEELNVLWYDTTLTDEQKRALLANSDKTWMKLGTKAAVQGVVQDIFSKATVDEFWEYDGQPHYFRIRVEEAGTLSAENEAKLLRTLEIVKRKSQWLESIFCETVSKMPLNVGFNVAFQRKANVRIDTWQDNAETTITNAGAAIYSRSK